MKTFAVPVEPVQKSSSTVVTSEKPFFDPAAGTGPRITGLVTQPLVVYTTGTSPVQATGDAASFTTAQPIEAPGARMKTATQPVVAPGAKVATQPVQTPGTRLVVLSKSTGASIEEVQSVTGKKT